MDAKCTTSIKVLALVISSAAAAGQDGSLIDTGPFRVGSALGELRTGFSGRPALRVYSSKQDPDWPSVEACLRDPVLLPNLDLFTCILIDEIAEPDLDTALRDQGVRASVRDLSGRILGLVNRGYTCVDLIAMLDRAELAMGGEPEKSPIYINLLERPHLLGVVAESQGCEQAQQYGQFLEEFEPDEPGIVARAWASLAGPCGLFQRGDANLDGALDVSDSVTILGFLFLGTPRTLCRDAADANDDSEVNITDPLFVLSFLFSGGSSIPPPGPERGPDPTEDPLDCKP